LLTDIVRSSDYTARNDTINGNEMEEIWKEAVAKLRHYRGIRVEGLSKIARIKFLQEGV
jgi:hypothetical protein